MKKILFGVFILPVILLFSACSDDEFGVSDIQGTWSVYFDTFTETNLEINKDGTYTMVLPALSKVVGNELRYRYEMETGTYTQDGSKILFTSSDRKQTHTMEIYTAKGDRMECFMQVPGTTSDSHPCAAKRIRPLFTDDWCGEWLFDSRIFNMYDTRLTMNPDYTYTGETHIRKSDGYYDDITISGRIQVCGKYLSIDNPELMFYVNEVSGDHLSVSIHMKDSFAGDYVVQWNRNR